MSWLDDYEGPHFRKKKSKDYASFIIKLVILVVFIGIVYYFVTSAPVQTSQQTVTDNTPSQPAAPVVSGPVFKSEAPNFDSHCTVAAGVVPGSIMNEEGNKVLFTFKNNGKDSIEGSYFEASNGDAKAYRQNKDVLAPGTSATYSIDLDDVSKEVGVMVKSFVIYPVQGGNACLNQRMIVIG